MDKTQFYPLKIKDIKRETSDTVSISIDVPEDLHRLFHFIPGQYINFRKHIDGEEVRRSYSLCSIPLDEEWRVAVKQVEEGKFSTYANQRMEVGEDIEVMPPDGRFVAKYENGIHLCIAAGSGITPIMSILRTLLEETDGANVILVYGNRTEQDEIFRHNLDELQQSFPDRLRLIRTYSRQDMNGNGTGRVDRVLLESLGLSFQTLAHAYLCGPSEMIFEMKDYLESKGISDERIHFELFAAPVAEAKDEQKEKPVGSTGPVSVKFLVDDDEFLVEDDGNDLSILDIGLKAGIDLPFACQGGVCCTCRARVVDGEVDMRQNFSLSDKEVNDGFVLTCQSHLKNGSVVVDYDQ
jgi:ring-1,2-phenylacetyl-CoA epoxidase subunit PaaE